MELRPHQKALVRKYSAKEIEDIFLVRSLLEPRAGALACRNLRDGDLDALHTLLVRMDNQILEHFIDQSARFIHLYLRATDTMIKAQTEHAEIYIACKSREQTLALLNESAFQSLKA